MNVNIYFSEMEKMEFLSRLGYNFETHTYKQWEQLGPYYSTGQWEEKTITCALKGDTVSSKENEINKIFEKEVTQKLKNLILSSNWLILP